MANNLPQFSTVTIENVSDHLDALLNNNRQQVAELLAQDSFCWENLLEPLSELADNLHQFWSPINHMNSVINSPALREAYNQCLPKLAEYSTELSHNKALYQAIKSIANSDQYAQLNTAQKKVIDNELRDFRLAGVALSEEKKQRFATLAKELSQLTTQFEENLLDATNHWKKRVSKQALLGLPEQALQQAEQRAKAENESGCMITLETPSYLAVMMHAHSRQLREEVYRAYNTRASDLGEKTEWDNTNVIQAILTKRLELAQLLGFNNYAEESLATKMAKNPEEVMLFLDQLASPSYQKAQQEFDELSQFARDHLNLEPLAAWDIAYASEKLRQHRYDISQEALRPYFSEANVLLGLFTIVNKLFGVSLREVSQFDRWHHDVKCYALYSDDETLLSYCYFDLYARPNKRGGAWMDDFRGRRKLSNGETQIPVAFVTCNFNGPTEQTPALFTHEEVITLFHEFGHALQHMLTTVDCLEVSGINGIPWDAVELASQFLENWAWQQQSLNLFATHYQDATPLPNALFAKLNQAKNFQSAMQMVRQLEFALFDFRLHREFDPAQKNQVQTILDEVRQQVSVVPTPDFNRFQHSFSHIFAGGYAAGYYSYKWAEVMASDAFSVFLEQGIFNQQAAQKFLTYLLQPGGSEEPAVLYKKYRGHEPRIEALLKQSGIIEE